MLGSIAASLGLSAAIADGKGHDELYRKAGEFLGMKPYEAYSWNDSMAVYGEPGDPAWEQASKRVTTALRRLADGKTWAEAIA